MIISTNKSTFQLGHNLSAISIRMLAYYCAFGLYVLTALFEKTTFHSFLGISSSTFVDITRGVVLILLIYKYLTQDLALSKWIITGTAIVIGFLSWRFSGVGWLFWLILFIVCSRGVSIKALSAITLAVTVTITFCAVAGSYVGAIENVENTFRVGSLRYSLGFTHPNAFGRALLVSCVAFSVLRFGKNPAPDLLIICLAILVNMSFAESKSSAAVALVQMILLLFYYFTRKPQIKKIFSYILIVFLGFIVFLSLFFTAAYDQGNAMHVMLNSALSSRLRLAHDYYQMQPLTLFGSDYSQFAPVYWENGVPSTFVVDNAYAHLFLRFGIIPGALLLIGLFGLLFKLAHSAEWEGLLFGLSLMLIYGIGEHYGLCIECNYFLVAIGTEMLFKNDERLSPKLTIMKNRELIRETNTIS